MPAEPAGFAVREELAVHAEPAARPRLALQALTVQAARLLGLEAWLQQQPCPLSGIVLLCLQLVPALPRLPLHHVGHCLHEACQHKQSVQHRWAEPPCCQLEMPACPAASGQAGRHLHCFAHQLDLLQSG